MIEIGVGFVGLRMSAARPCVLSEVPEWKPDGGPGWPSIQPAVALSLCSMMPAPTSTLPKMQSSQPAPWSESARVLFRPCAAASSAQRASS
eukprot:COSAG03_NODE_429_length_7977_cov_3.949606_10_plen_91_part_00